MSCQCQAKGDGSGCLGAILMFVIGLVVGSGGKRDDFRQEAVDHGAAVIVRDGLGNEHFVWRDRLTAETLNDLRQQADASVE